MQTGKLTSVFTTRLEKASIAYMVTGSVASMLYGEPRFTNDVDMVISLPLKHVDRLQEAFPTDQFYCPPVDVVILEVKRPLRGHFNIIDHETGFKADVYALGMDPFHRWGMTNRQRFELESGGIWLAPPEYVITRKLEYYREGGSDKHLHDIRCMLDVSSDLIDQDKLTEFIHELRLEKEWEQVQTGQLPLF